MSIRWTINVSAKTNHDLRAFLAKRGTENGDVSKFVEEAVQERLYQLAVEEAQARNNDLSEGAAAELSDEAVTWARKHKKQAA